MWITLCDWTIQCQLQKWRKCQRTRQLHLQQSVSAQASKYAWSLIPWFRKKFYHFIIIKSMDYCKNINIFGKSMNSDQLKSMLFKHKYTLYIYCFFLHVIPHPPFFQIFYICLLFLKAKFLKKTLTISNYGKTHQHLYNKFI